MFILFFDNRYFKWAPLLIESIMIHEPKERIAAYGYHLTESQEEKLCSYPCIDYISKALQRTEVILYVLQEGEFVYGKHDKTAIRIVQNTAGFLLESFRRFPKEKLYMLMDVDSLMVNPLTKIKKWMVDYDVGISVGKKKVKTGFILINPTKTTKKIIRDWNNLLMDGPCYWTKNQHTLFELYEKHKSEIHFLEFGAVYLDHRSEEESYIWSAYKSKFGNKAKRFVLYEKKLEAMRRDLK